MPAATIRNLALIALAATALAACPAKPAERDGRESETAAAAPSAPPADTSTAEGTTAAIAVQLRAISTAGDGVTTEAAARQAVDRMKAAYAELQTLVTKLKQQEPDASSENRVQISALFDQATRDIARTSGDLYAVDQKVGEIYMTEVNEMELFQTGPN
jgi:hypothetical protein